MSTGNYSNIEIDEFLKAANRDLGSDKYGSRQVLEDYAKAICIAKQLADERDGLLMVLDEIGKVLLKLSDDADSERYQRQNSKDSDFYLSEGKFAGIEKCESQVGKIINEAKAAAKKK